MPSYQQQITNIMSKLDPQLLRKCIKTTQQKQKSKIRLKLTHTTFFTHDGQEDYEMNSAVIKQAMKRNITRNSPKFVLLKFNYKEATCFINGYFSATQQQPYIDKIKVTKLKQALLFAQFHFLLY